MMGEILGLGLSHYPGPMVPVKYWPNMLARNVEHGRIKPEVFADKSRWPAGMRAEWGSDDGQTAAKEHQRRLMAGYKELGRRLDAFKPDVVVIWGDDQYENYKSDCVPAFCVGIFDKVVSKPFGGGRIPFKSDENAWGISVDTELPIRGHYEAARGLCQNLIENGFDVAYSRTVRHPAGLAHSFNNTVVYLDYEKRGIEYPVIPFHVNCYGNQLVNNSARTQGEGRDEVTPSGPTPKRCFDIGRATAQYFKASPWRVALVGSASWSHASLTAKHDKLYPDMEADRKRHAQLKSGEFSTWGSITQEEIDETGQHEVLNWICLAGAMTELGLRAEVIDYVETYIFNSAKCFAVFPPRSAAAE
jgi:hypothetical protein